MTQKYDIVVVGGGTSGLEAAKTAAQNGLKVALLERKSHPAKVQRACAQMFLMNMDSFYNEQMYFTQEQKKWIFPVRPQKGIFGQKLTHPKILRKHEKK